MDALYNFNLISIFDGEMVKIHFDDSETVEEIDEVKYLNRHIVNKNENFYRVHFMKYSKFDEYINHFNELHSWNTNFYTSLKKEFYDGINDSHSTEKLELLMADFEEEVLWYIDHVINEYSLDRIALKYDTNSRKMLIAVSGNNCSYEVDELIAERCRDDEKIKKHVKEAFKNIYHYNGDFEFMDYATVTLPF